MTTTLAPTSSERILEVIVDGSLPWPPEAAFSGPRPALSGGGAAAAAWAAVELTGSARAALVEQACAGDAALRGRLEALLKAHDDPGELPEGGLTGAYVPSRPPEPEVGKK